MTIGWRLVGIPAAACLAAAAIVSVRAQTLPEGRGRTEFQLLCTRCHDEERSTRLRLNADQWAAVVANMAERGMEGTADELDSVVAYLAANFGPDTPAAPARVAINAATAATLVQSLGLTATDAEAIVRHRERHGVFKDWADLATVPDIDIRKLEAQKDRIEFSQTTSGDGRREGSGS